MAGLQGLSEYLERNYHTSVFDQAFDSKSLWEVHIHPDRIVSAKIIANLQYDIKLDTDGQGEEELQKTRIKLLYPIENAQIIRPLIKKDKKVGSLNLEPEISPKNRHHIKNKSLYPIMEEKQVVFFTLLGGEVIRGLVAAFSRYDITVNLKGGIPVTFLRHSVYRFEDKKGRSYLKSIQEKQKDWQKSPLYIPDAVGA